MIRALGLLLFWGVCILLAGPLLVIHAFVTKNIGPLYRSATWLAITGVRLMGVKIKVVGAENIKAGQNYIFMSNHVSNLDPPIEIPLIPGRCSVLVKKELFRTPILGTGMKLAQLVPVDRSNREAAIDSVREAVAVLRLGLHMVIYPEGTRSPDGKLLPFKKGPFHLALESGVPIIPMTIVGSHEAWPKNQFALRPGTVTLVFHPPVDPREHTDREELTQVVRDAIASALPDNQQ